MKAAIVGALGVIGRNLLHYLERHTDAALVGISRRRPDFTTRAEWIAVDLLDRAAAEAALSRLEDVTHLFYCGFVLASTWAGHTAPNLALLVHSVEPIARASTRLRHVQLIEGTKIYGSHLGPFRTPAKETDPPHMPPNFYFEQERWLRRFAEGKPWRFSILRPQTVCGFSLRSPMNLAVGLAVYIAISKELGLPLRFPGTPLAHEKLYQVTDAELLAEAMLWAATSEAAQNRVFNVTNTDYFRWCYVFPEFARFFGMDYAGVQTIPLAEFMADKGPLWRDMQQRYGLLPHPFEELVSWPFVDYCLSRDYDVMSCTLAIRQAGFHRCLDSIDMFLRLFRRFREMRLIP